MYLNSEIKMESFRPYEPMNTFQPILKDYINLPCCESCCGDDFPGDGVNSCNSSFPPNDMSLDCLTSHLLTPPLSPEQTCATTSELPGIDTFTSTFLANPANSTVDELLTSNFAHDFPQVLPDLKDTCNELFDQDADRVKESSRKIFSQSSSKDCMWNGRGLRTAVRTRRHSRSTSPGSPACSPVSGCVDPRSVFNHYSDHRNSSSPRQVKVASGSETPSDTDEEVDVVTVEKTSPRGLATLGRMTGGGKVLGKLVQKKNGIHPQLALVATGRNRLDAVSSNQQARGRSQCKVKNQSAMSMVISGGKSGSKTVNVQLKCVPIVNPSTSCSVGKRKDSGSKEQASGTVVHVMRLTPTTEKNEADEPVVASKKRFLSLDGVSMVSNTGIKRARQEQSSTVTIKSEPVQTVAAFPDQKVQERKKICHKSAKRPVPSLYETPTTSPGSSNDEFPASPKKKESGDEAIAIRAAHNVLERQRREGLRNLYHDLRLAVPSVSEVEKAPKVSILTKAKEHVVELQREAAELRSRKLLEQDRQNKLKQRLHDMASELTTVGAATFTNSSYFKRHRPETSHNLAVFVS